MNGTIDRRFVAGLLLTGAVLALVGNALHPFLDPDGGGAELVAAAGESSTWVGLHLLVVTAVVVLTVGTVMFARGYTGTAGESTARVAAVLATIGGTIFVVQLGGLDGAVMPALADQLAAGADEATVLALAETMAALDVALLSIVVTLYLGATFVALGLALLRTDTFAPWIRWTGIVAGGTGMVLGVLMYLDIANTLTFYGFRVVALAITIATFGLAVELRRDAATAPARPAAAATA